MIAELDTYLRTFPGLSDEQIGHMGSLAIPRSLQRQESLLRPGQVSRHKVLVIRGLLRTFGIAADGSEHILHFSPEHTWTLDAESYDHQIPSQFHIAAIERSEVLMWTKTDFERLLTEIPALKALSQQLISRTIYNSRHRLLTVLGATPEEKYEDFVRAFPDLLSRLPLRMIAAYLGISLKTLTRIRHAQLHR